VNGDGIHDVIIGALNADPNGTGSGQSYVVFGRDAAGGDVFPAEVELGALNGTDGFKLNGASEYDLSGHNVSGAGDVNGDGIDDIMIGAPGRGQYYHYDDPGRSYVVFGRDTTGGDIFPVEVELAALDGADGFTLNSANASDYASRVSGAGDVNGDGIDDIIIGAPGVGGYGISFGQSYVVFGRDTAGGDIFPPEVELAALDGTEGFKLNGTNPGDYSGNSVSGVGDVNGDGINDVIIGAVGADPNGSRSGQSYVVFGKDTPGGDAFPAEVELGALDGTEGFKLNGVNANDLSSGFGSGVSGAGDVNGDGIDDIIVGAQGADTNGYDTGQSYVVFGRDTSGGDIFPAEVELGALDGTEGFKLNGVSGDYSGRSVSGVGDFNGDGIDDIIISAHEADPNGYYSGRSYVVFGELPVKDSDGDGVSDDVDQCEMSDLSPTVVVDGCDSGVTNPLLDEPLGCTITDVIVSFGEEAENHGKFSSASAHFLRDLVQSGDLTETEKDAVQSCVGIADLP
jgi:hypothetical protein